MRLAIRFALAALALRAALAQGQPSAAEILKKVAETYKAASQYELVADATAGGARTAPTHMLLAVSLPNRYRMEGALPGLSGGDSEFTDAVIVCDGTAIWMYLRKSNQYVSIPLSGLHPDGPGDLGDLRPEVMDQSAMMRYRGAADFAERAKFLREEAIEIAGAKVECYVVAVPV